MTMKDIRRIHDEIRLNEYIEGPDAPPITHTQIFYKEYPRLDSINLDLKQDTSEFETLLELRDSVREFSDRPLSMREISRIIASCQRKRDSEKRTYPSGGGRYPVEMYILSFNIQGLDMGVYHYNQKEKNLDVLLRDNIRDRMRNIVSPYIDNPAASIFLTSVLSRSEIKYGKRAYPYSLIEAGHMGQNILLAATEIGVGSCPVSGFINSEIEEMLDLTNDEIPIYSICLGHKRRI